MRSICVFCGASSGRDAQYAAAAASFGRLLARENIELVWGGGHVGLMGVVADGVLEAGGRVFGVIPTFMAERELAHPQASEMVVVDSMHARKAAMADRADGFVALPGGFGTLDELFEAWTWNALGYHAKPFCLLNVKGFWSPLGDFMDHVRDAGFLSHARRGQLMMARDSAEAIKMLENAASNANQGRVW